MANIRVGELAKELNVTSKEVLESLKKRNVELKSNLSSVLPEDADAVRADLKKTEEEQPRRRVRPEGEEEKNRRNMPERESSDRARSPRTEGETAEKPRRQFRSRNERTDGDRPQRQRQDSMSATEVRKPDGKENRRNAEKKREDRKREERQRKTEKTIRIKAEEKQKIKRDSRSR